MISERKYVCLHVRDGGFKNDYKRSSKRNATFDNYIELIKYLCANNILVVRMGDNKMIKSSFKHENYCY